MNKNNNISLPVRIIIYMVIILLFTAVTIVIITTSHLNEQTRQYNEEILNRKVKTVELAIDYEMDKFTAAVTKENINKILENNFFKISDISKTDIIIYDLSGKKTLTTQPDSKQYSQLSQNILNQLKKSDELILMKEDSDGNKDMYISYSYIKNYHNDNLAILCLPYQTNKYFFQKNVYVLLGSYGLAFGFILLFGTLAVYFVTKRMLEKISSFADRIRETGVTSNNMSIKYNGNDEIKILVDSYNTMIKKLREQCDLISKLEKEEALRDFSKQIAHEVKNPLTPMKLLIQNYLRKFDVNDPHIVERTKQTSKILLEQIDAISSMVEVFSDFAKIASKVDEKLDIVEIIKKSLLIFPSKNIEFTHSPETIMMNFDKQYLEKIIMNITKNAFQSIPNGVEPKIKVSVYLENNFVHLNISDNGTGIPSNEKESIFSPKFSTKNSGMGMGLSIVKRIVDDYGGTINFETKPSVGTTFFIMIPCHE